MALLNIAEQLSDLDNLEYNEVGKSDYLKLFFTKDKHLITHGVDFLEDYKITRGLVPSYSLSNFDYGILGKTGWEKISLAHLPIKESLESALSASNETILSTAQTVEYIGNRIKAADALRFKGTITYTSENKYEVNTSDGTSYTFPESAEIGDTYKISGSGTFGGHVCVPGDMIICISAYDSSTNGNTSEYWQAIESNINGYVTVSINNTPYQLYSANNVGKQFTLFAPSGGGTENQILASSGSAAPKWINQNEIIAKDITTNAKKALFTDFSISESGEVSVTVGGTEKSATASGTWGINISGTAGSVKESLLPGIGLTMGEIVKSYNGNTETTIDLVAATTTSLGGVKVGDNITVNSGTISITGENIIAALGYTPADDVNAGLYSMYLTNDTEDNSENINNPYITLAATRGDDSSIQVVGGDKINVTNSDGNILISSSWRDILFDDHSVGDNSINFEPSESIYINAESSDNKTNVSFGLCWYDITNNKTNPVN